MNLFIRAVLPGSSRGWAILMVVVLALLVSGTWMMAGASEQRSTRQMLERLTSGLQEHGLQWETGSAGGSYSVPAVNPFLLLDERPDSYCGEVRGEQPLQRGCWYYRPQDGQVIYRSRFGQHFGGGQVQVWNLVVLPAERPGTIAAVELHAAQPVN